MKKIKVKDKVCFNCAHFTAYYTAGVHDFYPSGYGYCGVKASIMRQTDVCDCFRFCSHIPVEVNEVENAIFAVESIYKLYK